MQASVSLVFVVVIDWTRMGESLPIVTLPTWVVVVCLRCMVYGGGGWLPCGVWGLPCGVWVLPCGDWIAAVVTAQWLMFEERGPALRVVPALRVGAALRVMGLP